MNNREALRINFDFDMGHLIKSPCRDCGTYDVFPDCMERCAVLDRIQTILTSSIPPAATVRHSSITQCSMEAEALEVSQVSAIALGG